MKTASISRLKATLSAYIASVKGGEEVVVTDRGKPVARIVPVGSEVGEGDRVRDLVARGVIRPGRAKPACALGELPICAAPEGAVRRVIDAERREPL